MPDSTFRVSLREARSPHALEAHPRYIVLLNGVARGELYHNMTGYRGALPTHLGLPMDIGERGISAWKREAGAINRRARDAAETNAASNRRIIDTEPTEDGRFLIADIGVKGGDGDVAISSMVIDARELSAAERLFGHGNVSPDILTEETRKRHALDATGWAAGKTRITLAALETDDPEWTCVICGTAPDIPDGTWVPRLFRDLHPWMETDEDPTATASYMLSEDWDRMATYRQRDVFPAAQLPGGGFADQRLDPFAIEEAHPKPAVVESETARLFGGALSRRGIGILPSPDSRTTAPDIEP